MPRDSSGNEGPLHVVAYDGLDALPDGYSRLFAACGARSVFLTRDWFSTYERAILGEDRARVYGVETTSGPAAGVGALVMRPLPGRAPPWQARRFEGLSNYYSSLYGPLVADPARQDEAVRALAEALWADRTRWDLLDLRPLDTEAAEFAVLCDALRAAGAVVETYFCFGNWYLEVAGKSYAEYLAGRSSTLRKNIPYYRRRLDKNPAARIEIVTGGAALEQALRDYDKVYSASWKIPEPFPHFVQRLAQCAAANGWLRLGLVHIDGEPAAAQIWIVHEGTASIFKIAYDERFKKHSVGTVLTARLMEHVIDVDKVRCVDYLSGDDPYKKEWMSHRRERWGILAINPRSPRGLWEAARSVGTRAAKALLRSFRSQGRRDCEAPVGAPKS